MCKTNHCQMFGIYLGEKCNQCAAITFLFFNTCTEDDSLKKTTHGPRTSSKRGRSSGNRGRAPPTVKKATKHVGREPSLPDNQKLSLSSEPESEAWEALKIHTKKTSLNGDSRVSLEWLLTFFLFSL